MSLFRVGQPVIVHHQKPWQSGGPITLRGTVESFDGYRLCVERRFRSPGQSYDGLPATQRPGDHGTIELLREAWVSRRRYLRADGELIGELYNIQTPTRFLADMALYADLEIDVAYVPDVRKKVLVQDKKELEAAVRWGFISEQMADVARALAEELAGRLRHWDGASDADWNIHPDDRLASAALEDFARRWPGVLRLHPSRSVT